MSTILAPKRLRISQVIVGLSIVQFVAQAIYFSKGVEFVVAQLTIDDTYYYLQTAWNLTLSGFPTFDGLHPTNGVQLLWFWILVLLRLISPTKIAYLYVALTASFLLNALCHLFFIKLSQLFRRPDLGLYLACFWLFLNLGSHAYLHGLENSLHAFIFWAVVWQGAVCLFAVQRGQRPPLVGLTLLLILNAWARLDSAVYSVLIYTTLCVAAFASKSLQIAKSADRRYVAFTALLAGTGMAIQLWIFRRMGGSYLPISGMVKNRGLRVTHDTIGNLMRLGASDHLPIWIGPAAVALLMILYYVNSSPESAQLERKVWRRLWHLLLLCNLVYLAGIGPFAYVEVWYRSPLYAFWGLTLAAYAVEIGEIVMRWRLARVVRTATATICILSVCAAGILYVERFTNEHADNYSNLYVNRYRVALWADQHLPQQAVLAAWSSGQLGYFSDRTVINLDGLINSASYYQRVLKGSVTLEQYLYENHVSYLIDYWESNNLAHDFPVLRQFSLGDSLINVWQIALDLPSGYPTVGSPIANHMHINLGNLVWLEGYTLKPGPSLHPGQTFELSLYWRAQKPIDKSYKVFDQAFYGNGVMIAQQDGYPVHGALDTTHWQRGRLIADVHKITVKAGAPPGVYPLYTGSILKSP